MHQVEFDLTTKTTMKTMRLETKIKQLMPQGESFDVIAYELWGNRRDGFDCNDSWNIGRNCTADDAIRHARGRWEVFKVNYVPNARVKDITNDSCDESEALLSVDCVPFLEIRKAP